MSADAVSLREHLEALIREQDIRNGQRFEAQEKAVAAALTAAGQAVQKAEVAAEKRFDAVNEFRAQLSDQAGTFMPRAETEIRFTAMQEKVDLIAHQQALLAGRGGGRDQLLGYAFGLAGAVAAVAAIVVAFTR